MPFSIHKSLQRGLLIFPDLNLLSFLFAFRRPAHTASAVAAKLAEVTILAWMLFILIFGHRYIITLPGPQVHTNGSGALHCALIVL
jgi:hypothetical protein